jgi:NAD(P)H-hydrate epimerase
MKEHYSKRERKFMVFPTYPSNVPYVTTEQMIEVDQAMMQDYRIELIQMMENAGRNLAHLARIRFLYGNPQDKKVIVLAGTGGNGGGALVCARRLHNWGAQVQVFVTRLAQDFTPVPAHQLDILQRMKVPIAQADAITLVTGPELIIDGLVGYSLKGAPRGSVAKLIRWANRDPAPILALDAPSGVDTTTGTTFDPAIKATATMTLALPKAGLHAPGVEVQVGELYLADISVPPSLYAEPALALEVGPLFAESEILRLR